MKKRDYISNSSQLTQAGENLLEETSRLLEQSKSNLNQPLDFSNAFGFATQVLKEKFNTPGSNDISIPNNNLTEHPIPDFLKSWNLNTPSLIHSENDYSNWTNYTIPEIMGYSDSDSDSD